MSYAEIASVLDCPVSAIETLLFRARRSFARSFHSIEASPQTRCKNARQVMSVLLDGEATQLQRQLVTSHTSGCAGCRTELRRLQGADAAYAGLPLAPLPVALLGLFGNGAATGGAGLLGAMFKLGALAAGKGKILAGATAIATLVGGAAGVHELATTGGAGPAGGREQPSAAAPRQAVPSFAEAIRFDRVQALPSGLAMAGVVSSGDGSTDPGVADAASPLDPVTNGLPAPPSGGASSAGPASPGSAGVSPGPEAPGDVSGVLPTVTTTLDHTTSVVTGAVQDTVAIVNAVATATAQLLDSALTGVAAFIEDPSLENAGVLVEALVEDTLDLAENTSDGTTDLVANAGAGATSAVDGAVAGTTGALDDATGGATTAVSETVNETVGAVTETVDETVVTGAEAVDETVGVVTDTVGGVVGGLTDGLLGGGGSGAGDSSSGGSGGGGGLLGGLFP